MLFVVIVVTSGVVAAAVAAYYVLHDPTAQTQVDFNRQTTKPLQPLDPKSPISCLTSATHYSPVNHVKTPIPSGRSKQVEAKLTLLNCCEPVTPKAVSTRKRRAFSSSSLSAASNSDLSPVTSRLSVCDCRTSEDSDVMVRDDESVAMSAEELRFSTAPTKIMPINFSRYTPLDLAKMTEEDMRNGLCDEAVQEVLPDMKQSILTPFRPILHSIVYSAKHAFLLSELAKEYEYTDD